MVDQIIIQKRPPKSPAAAGILSGFFPGTGSFYNGQYSKGIIFILIFAGIISMLDRGGHPFFGILMAGFYIFQIIDSVNSARAINRAALGDPGASGAGETLPTINLPTPSGSVFWGAILMALGGIFLLANFNLLDFDRLWDFWPVIVIVIGLKLIADYFSKRNV
jgi:hypothetical protein